MADYSGLVPSTYTDLGLGSIDISSPIADYSQYTSTPYTDLGLGLNSSYSPDLGFVDISGYDFSGLQDNSSWYSGLTDTISSGFDWLGKNKDSINALGGLYNTYSNYQSLQNQQDIAKQQLALQRDYYANLEAERQRQIGLQEEATSGMQTGLGLSALNTNKKSKTNYYSV